MPYRQSHPPSTSDGLIGGAFVVVGFVALIVIAAVDLISSRWPPSTPSSETTQDKPGTSVTPLQKDDAAPTPTFVKGPIEDQNPLSDVHMSGNTEDSALAPNPTDRQVQPEENQLSYPLIPDLDDKDTAEVEESRAQVPLDPDQVLSQEDSHTADINEVTVPVANDSSQEWVSLSKPDPESLSFIKASDADPVPTASFIHEHQQLEGPPSHQQEPTVEFSSSTLIDAPTELHQSATTIRSDTSSPPPSTPELDTHSFDNNNNAAAAAAAVVHIRIQTDEDKQAPLNPESSLEFGSVSEVLKARRSIRSLYDSSNSINRSGIEELSTKKKRGSSFIKKSGTLINKVFKNKDASSNNHDHDHDDHDQRRSSFDTMEHSSTRPDTVSSAHKKLTSPSRVSLGSIRSISGSIKKKIGKGSFNANNDTAATSKDANTVSGSAAAVNTQEEESHPEPLTDGPSLLKTMFKVRKPSE